MKHILKPAFTLFAIAVIVTASLSIGRRLTLEPIENQRRIAQEKTMKEALEEAAGFRELTGTEAKISGSIVRIFEGSKNGQPAGYVIELAPSGYSGSISMMVGISSARNSISGMRILRHTETPGLGALAVKENFFRRFDGKKLAPLKVTKLNPAENEIQAITGATITSNAVTGAVNEAIEWYNRNRR